MQVQNEYPIVHHERDTIRCCGFIFRWLKEVLKINWVAWRHRRSPCCCCCVSDYSVVVEAAAAAVVMRESDYHTRGTNETNASVY